MARKKPAEKSAGKTGNLIIIDDKVIITRKDEKVKTFSSSGKREKMIPFPSKNSETLHSPKIGEWSRLWTTVKGVIVVLNQLSSSKRWLLLVATVFIITLLG